MKSKRETWVHAFIGTAMLWGLLYIMLLGMYASQPENQIISSDLYGEMTVAELNASQLVMDDGNNGNEAQADYGDGD